MLLVLASRHDPHAVDLVRHWRQANARLLTCDDFSRSGWEFHPGEPERSRFAVGGRSVSARQVRGVLVRLPVVTVGELPRIEPEDREYVAAELMAFLVALLRELSCPVINRPSPLLLTGPAWGRDHWHCEARRLEIPGPEVQRELEMNRSEVGSLPGKRITDAVTVVGEDCFGSRCALAREFALRLARRAGVTLLRVAFGRHGGQPQFLNAELIPGLESPAVKRAVYRHLTESRPATARPQR